MNDANRNPLAGFLPDLFSARAGDDQRREVERAAPGTLRFDGVLAGLFGRTGSGDRNDPSNYVLFCPSCGAALGVLASWKPWRNGVRAVRCIGQDTEGRICDTVTVLGPRGEILRTAPGAAYDAWMRTQQERQSHERALEKQEQAERAHRDGTEDW